MSHDRARFFFSRPQNPLVSVPRAQLPFGRSIASLVLTPLALGVAQLAGAQAAPAAPEGPALREVRINATAEKDVGFAPAQAETAGKAPMRLLETPQSISVVTREQMESRQSATLQQALQTVAGVSPVNFGRRGFDDINIRGFRSTESILIDGLVQSPGMWTRLVPYGYERFEVLKGASSILYGQVQPGGLVNAVSKRPKREAMSEVSVEAGSFGLKTLSADLNRPLSESGKSAFRVNAYTSETDDPVDSVWRKDQWLAPSLSLDLGPSTDLVLFATYSRSRWIRMQGISPYGTLLPNRNGTLPLTRFAGEPSFGPYDVKQVTLGYALEHQFSPGLVLRQNVRYEEETGEGRLVANQALQANQRLQNRSATLQKLNYDILATDTSLLANFQALGLAHRLVAGLDARSGTSRQASFTCSIGALDLFNPVYGVPVTCPATAGTNAPSKLSVAGLYLQDQLKFGGGWTALLGVRHETSRNEIDDLVRGTRTVQKDKATTGSAGLVYEFTPGWSAYGSYSESFLPVSGQTFAGTPFDPETGKQREAGLKYERPGGGLTGSMALYDLTRRNVTTADPLNNGFSVQTGEQRSRGLELEVGADVAAGVKLTASYTYTNAKVTRDNNASIVGKPAILTPRHVAALWATWRLPDLQRVTLGLGGRYVSEQVGALPFTLPSYFVADASLTYLGDNWRLTAGVKNLFNKVYYDGAVNANVVSPAAPRNFMVSATYFF
jgi:iron complex outermembrane receptor protein